MGTLRKALVVDDDEGVREALAELLADSGFTVVTAVNGADALQQLAAGERPDVIVLDVMMPVMDGVEFRRRQKASPFADIPVIVLSAASRAPEEVQIGGALAGCDFLPKPFDIERLVDAIDRCAPAA